MITKTGNSITTGQVSGMLSQEKPLIFWDTCSLLNILELAMNKKDKDVLEAYQKIYKLIRDKRVISVTSYYSLVEFNNNTERVEKRQIDDQTDLRGNIKKFAIVAPQRWMKIIHCVLNRVFGYDSKLESLVKSIYKHTYIIKVDVDQKKFAYDRLVNRQAPSERKPSYGDNLLWGAFLSTSLALGGTKKRIFMTSNPEDFKAKGSNNLATIIKDEMSRNGVEVCFDIKKAYQIMRADIER